MEAQKEIRTWLDAEIAKGKETFKDLEKPAVIRLKAAERTDTLMEVVIKLQELELEETNQQIASWAEYKPDKKYEHFMSGDINATGMGLCEEIKRQSENDMIQTTSDTPSEYGIKRMKCIATVKNLVEEGLTYDSANAVAGKIFEVKSVSDADFQVEIEGEWLYYISKNYFISDDADYMHLTDQERREMEIVSEAKIKQPH